MATTKGSERAGNMRGRYRREDIRQDRHACWEDREGKGSRCTEMFGDRKLFKKLGRWPRSSHQLLITECRSIQNALECALVTGTIHFSQREEEGINKPSAEGHVSVR